MKSARKLSILAAVAATAGLAALSSAASAATVSVTTAMGNGADTYLINDSGPGAGNPQGTGGAIEVRNYDGVRQRIGFVRFDLSAYQGDTISNPTFSITADGLNRDRVVALYGFTNYAYTNASTNQSFDWSEKNTLYPGNAAAVGGASALSRYNFRINADQLSASVGYLHVPLDALLLRVGIRGPCCGFLP